MYRLFLLLPLVAASAWGDGGVVAITIDSAIHPITAEIVTHAIEEAQERKAAALLIRLNTPGGLLDATRVTMEKIIASPVPVVTFVTPSGGRAASAGFFILQAGDVAAMQQGTHTGAASPVSIGQPMEEVMRAKVENDTSAMLRSVTEKRGRNREAAEKTIRNATSYTDSEALENNLVDLVVQDEASLLRQLNGREITRFDGRKEKLALAGAVVAEYELTTREKLISAIADPNLAFLMLALGGVLLYFEFTVPGLVGPGVAGAILFLLGMMSLSVLPINWAAVALLIAAVVMFVLEAKVTSGGLLGLGGAVAMVLGAMMLIEGPPEFRIRLSTALAVTIPFAAITVFLMSLVLKAHRQPAVTGMGGMMGAGGIASTDLTPRGKVHVHGEYWDAVAPAPVAKGSLVRVTRVDGLKLEVEERKES
ncbi:MAG: nodulation protein NfeD [Bryobacteraceae bacterium]|nr:nodulation protein NfeD [Bryobacteraceae bacterium]